MVNFDLNSQRNSKEKFIKQQINDIIQKIAESTGKTPQEIYAMVRVIGQSMDPLFKHGANIPVKLMPFDANYKKGDIIAFEHNGEFVIHKVEYRFKSDDGKVYYITGGINPITNQFVDNWLVSQEDVIGKADLSRKSTVKVAKQGQVVYFDAYGMPTQNGYINDRMILLEQYIKDGLNEDELIKKYGGKKIFENELEEFYGVSSLEKARAIVMENVLNKFRKKIIQADEAIKELNENGYKIIDPANPHAINELDKYCKLLWGDDYNNKKSSNYHRFFRTEWMRGYIVLSLLDQFLGFDPLFFQKLDDGIFLKTIEERMEYYKKQGYSEDEIQKFENIQYVLHHINLDLKADIRQLSFEIFDLILTNSRLHKPYEGLPEAESRNLMAAWDKFLNLEGLINENHIREIFKNVKINGEIVYEKYRWFDDKEIFEKTINELNIFKAMKEKYGSDTLLRKKFPIASNRWIKNEDNYLFIYEVSQKIHYYLLEQYQK